MRENKYDSLLNVSIVILIVSTVLLGITGYNIFFKNKPYANSPVLNAFRKDAVRDSLRGVYSRTVQNIDNSLQSEGSSISDKNALGQMSSLRFEIDSLLRQHASESDLATARVKIEELQQRVFELQNRYSNAENENKRLQALINKLVANDKSIPGVVAAEPQTQRPGSSPTEKNISSGGTLVGALHLFAVSDNKSTEEETTSSDEAEKIVGSFLIKNAAAKAGGEVVVVVLQPDGKVIKNSVWESGTFETKEGKKVYSRKIYFDPSGDEKQLNFFLTPDKFLKGDYTMQIWYNGNLVGKTTKTLS